MKYISVAVDGPAGAGKSSVSKAVAKSLGYTYIDTGAMYRAVALFAINNGIDAKNETEKLVSRLNEVEIDIKYTDEGQQIYLLGENVSKRIREEDVSVGASNVAVIPEVRKKLVELQRKMAESANVIMDGRDTVSYTHLPEEILTEYEVDDSEAIMKWLSGIRKRKVTIAMPKRGEKLHLVEMVRKNADIALGNYKIKVMKEREKNTVLDMMQEQLRLEKRPYRIEAYDISNIQGTDNAVSYTHLAYTNVKQGEFFARKR